MLVPRNYILMLPALTFSRSPCFFAYRFVCFFPSFQVVSLWRWSSGVPYLIHT